MLPPVPAEALCDLDNLLRLLPGLSRQRSINASWLRILFDRQKKECTWCGKPVPPRSSTWCSPVCVTAFNLRCSPQHQTTFVAQRDKHCCQICGRDTRAAEQAGKLAWAAERHLYPYPTPYSVYGPAQAQIYQRFGYGRGRWREVDHIVPVVLGGGLCHTDNLRLLCGACHETETTKLAGGRRTKRKAKR